MNNKIKIADSVEEFEVVKPTKIMEDPYKDINSILELIEILIDKKMLNSSCESNR